MDTLIRNRYMQHLEHTSILANVYASAPYEFTAGVAGWLKEVEETLQQLRQPCVSLVSSERVRLLAVSDGNVEPGICGKTSRRKMERLVARSALATVEELLRDKVLAIDERFADLRDKLAQAVSIAHANSPLLLPLPPGEPRERGLRAVWNQCGEFGPVAPLFRFLEAALQPMDRLNLLDDIVRNLAGLPEPSLGP